MSELRTIYWCYFGLVVISTMTTRFWMPKAWASQDKPLVTNGGYMETRTAGGKSVPLPLKHTDVEAEVAGMVASVKVAQHFHNPFKKPIEAIYVFPLPHRAAIYKMDIQIGERTIKGLVKKRAEAKAIYQRAKAAGKTAALLEQERPNIFTQSIANIMPGDQIKVEILYVEDLVQETGQYEFSFPMVVGPRYVGGGEVLGQKSGTGWGKDTTRIPDASRITPKLLAHGLRPGNDISVRLNINGGVPVKKIQVVSHRAKVVKHGLLASVTLDKSDTIPNKDFVVRYQLAGQQPEVSVLAQRDKRSGHFLLMIHPKAEMQPQDVAPREYVFVVDNSGSMSGFPLNQAQAVVSRCLKNVGSKDSFQIIKFAGYPDQFAPHAVRATPAAVKKAIQYVQKMRGGGGTEFIPALRLALLAKKDPSRSRIVLFITDGYIGYENQVLRFLRDNAKGINVFALGIGSSVNRFLIDGMARIGVGEPFYLLNTEKAKGVVKHIFATISKPALTNIDINWSSLDVEEMTPAAVPDLFGEKPVFVAGRYSKGGIATVTIRGRLAGSPFVKKVQVSLPKKPTANNQAVAYLWARRQIADWMDLYAIEPSRREELEKSITEVALNYNLMSRFTSFIAVDSQVRNQGGQQSTVNVPVPLPQGVSPLAAPQNAYIHRKGGYARGGRLAMAKSYALGAASSSPMPPSEASRQGPARHRRLTRRTAGSYTRFQNQDDELAVRDEKSKPKNVKIRINLDGSLQVQGAGNQVVLEKEIKKLLSKLARSLRSIRPGTTGRLRLRITVDSKGRVSKVAFVSGTLMLPSLKNELKKSISTWHLLSGAPGATITFSIRFNE